YAIVVVYFSATAGNFLSYNNAINILSNVSVLGIVSLGQAMVVIVGGFDLSVAGVVPLAAVTFVGVSNNGAPAPIATVAALAVGASVGLFNGVLVTRVGINALITTLGTWSATTGLAFTVVGGTTQTLRDIHAAYIANTVV